MMRRPSLASLAPPTLHASRAALLTTVVGALGATWPTRAAANGPQAAIEYEPLALLIDRFSAAIEIVPISHHALVLSPFYFNSRTPTFQNATGEVASSRRFGGFGGELGYRMRPPSATRSEICAA